MASLRRQRRTDSDLAAAELLTKLARFGPALSSRLRCVPQSSLKVAGSAMPRAVAQHNKVIEL